MIRRAVGAIVYKGNKFLIVGKVKLMDMPGGPTSVPLAWYIPGGGVKDSDETNEYAIMRELKEETGSQNFKIIKVFDKRLCFNFPLEIQEKSGFNAQETVMFLVEYTGTGIDLIPHDEEIDRVEFVTATEFFRRIFVEETKEYFQNVLNELSLEGHIFENKSM